MLVDMMKLLGYALALGVLGTLTPVCSQEAQVGQVIVKPPAEQEGWFVEGDVTFADRVIHLKSTELNRAAITSKTTLTNDEFALSFEFRINSEDTAGQHDGLHVGLRYPLKEHHWDAASYLWDVDLANARLLVRSRQHGETKAVPLLYSNLEVDTWYLLEILNRPEWTRITLRTSPEGLLLGSRIVQHDDAPDVAQPLVFWADSDLQGIKPRDKPPVIGVFAPYNQYNLSNEWSPYIKVGGSLRSIGIARPETTSQTPWSPEGEVRVGRLSLVKTSGDRLFLKNVAQNRLLLELPGPESCPYKVANTSLDHRRNAATQTWSNPSGEILHITYLLQPGKPYVRVQLRAVNAMGGARRTDFAFVPKPTADFPYYARGFSFPWKQFDWQSYYAEGRFDFDLDFANEPLQFRWGIAELSWGDGPGVAPFLPIVAIRGKGDESLVVAWDNRVSLGFRADSSNWNVTKRFHLDQAAGFADSGFDVQDGDGEIPHEIIIGYTPKSDWPTLINDFYLDAYPLYDMDQMPPDIVLEPGLQGSHETFFTSEPWTEEKAREQAMDGARSVGLFFAHANLSRYAREFGMNQRGVELARKYGMQIAMSDNIAVSPQPMPITDPKQCYTNFADSWVYDAAGNGPFINWEGITVNQSPKFSYGAFELQHHKNLIEQYKIDHDYMDLYYAWGTDYGHSYRHYGFYPMIVGINEWMRVKSAYLHRKRIPYVLNAPHRHSSLVRFGEIVQGDIGDIEFFPIFHKVQSGSRLLRTYGAATDAVYDLDNPRYRGKDGYERRCVEFALFNGMARQGLPSRDAPPEERAIAVEILNKNIGLGFAVGQARLVDGDVFRQYHYIGSDGTKFVTIRNPKAEQSTMQARFSRRQRVLAKQTYTLFEWDIDEGASLLDSQIKGADLLAQAWTVQLAPHQTKALIAIPSLGLGVGAIPTSNSPQVMPGYLAWLPERHALVKFSTGSIGRAAPLDAITVSATENRRTLTRIAVPEDCTIEVAGAKSFYLHREGDHTDVTIIHGKRDARITIGS